MVFSKVQCFFSQFRALASIFFVQSWQFQAMPLSADILSIQSLLIAEDLFIHSFSPKLHCYYMSGCSNNILHSQANAIIIIIIILLLFYYYYYYYYYTIIIIIIIIFVTIDIEKIIAMVQIIVIFIIK